MSIKIIDLREKTNLYLVIFSFLQIAALIYYLNFFYANSYLPSPFINDKSNTFMDFFNTLCWYSREEYYSIWYSVYPPINFIFLQVIHAIFGVESCGGSPEIYRTENIILVTPLLIMMVIFPFVLINACLNNGLSSDISFQQKILFYVIMILSPPVLFALERGNLILISIFVIAFLLSKDKEHYRVLLIAILINLKPYFLILSLYYLAKKDLLSLIKIALISAFIFVVTGALLTDNYWLFFSNLLDFSGHEMLFSRREVLSFPSSVSAFSYVLSTLQPFYIAFSLDSEDVASLVGLIKNLLLLFSTLIFIKNGNILKPQESFFYLIVLITNIGVSVGGYSLLFYLPFLPYLILSKQASFQNNAILVCVLMLNTAFFDCFTLLSQNIGMMYSYLGDKTVSVDWAITFGSVLRPVLNMLLLLFLTVLLAMKKNFMHTSYKMV